MSRMPAGADRFARGALSLWGASLAGALVGVGVLHPLTMVIYWFEFHPEVAGVSTVWAFVALRVRSGFSPAMWHMTGIFALMGAVLGLATGWATRTLTLRRRQVDQLQAELTRSLASLLAAGEGEMVEFKASARWDYREGRISRDVEGAVVRTIAGFMNHRGGSLLLGVDDAGVPIGLHYDLVSLRRQDQDGFQQFVVELVERALGADSCSLLHILFQGVGSTEICRVVVEPAAGPVYVRDAHGAHYFLRTGNGTRELDAREAVDHISARWPRRG